MFCIRMTSSDEYLSSFRIDEDEHTLKERSLEGVALFGEDDITVLVLCLIVPEGIDALAARLHVVLAVVWLSSVAIGLPPDILMPFYVDCADGAERVGCVFQ